jgi:hypothetical protein
MGLPRRQELADLVDQILKNHRVPKNWARAMSPSDMAYIAQLLNECENGTEADELVPDREFAGPQG